MVHYLIKPINPGAHLLSVEITIPEGHDVIHLKLPKWIPGSYKIRDYIQHVHAITVNSCSSVLSYKSIGNNLIKIEAQKSPIKVSYLVYAYDLSVRGCYFDQTRLFLNFCAICFEVNELANMACTVQFDLDDSVDVFTALPKRNTIYYADNYQHLIDCPVEIAQSNQAVSVDVNGYKHSLVFTGWLDENYDLTFLANSIQSICQVQMQLFQGSPLIQDYLFMTYLEPKQYGGLEHEHSTALMASPDMIKKKGEALTDLQIEYLGLCSHEYFHLWNIKRLKPKDLMPYDLYQEQPTEMLWMFEGFTSYYDELMLLRAGIVTKEQFVQRQSKNMTRVLGVYARKNQTIAESSFNAWTKLYQANENAGNMFISYYSKGAYVALYLDLFIRKFSNNQFSLDQVMQSLWNHYGKKQVGIDEQIVLSTCLSYLPKLQHDVFKEVFFEGIHGTKDLDFQAILTDFGIDYQLFPQTLSNGQPKTTDPGFSYALSEQKIIIKQLDISSKASQLGLSANDEIIAVNRTLASESLVLNTLYQGKEGDKVVLTLNRRDKLFDVVVNLSKSEKNQVSLSINGLNKLGKSWLEIWV